MEYRGIKNIGPDIFHCAEVSGLMPGGTAFISEKGATTLAASFPHDLELLDAQWSKDAVAEGTVRVGTAYAPPYVEAELTEDEQEARDEYASAALAAQVDPSEEAGDNKLAAEAKARAAQEQATAEARAVADKAQADADAEATACAEAEKAHAEAKALEEATAKANAETQAAAAKAKADAEAEELAKSNEKAEALNTPAPTKKAAA